MTKPLRLVFAIVCAGTLHFAAKSQSLSVNTTGAAAHPSAILDVSSNLKGVLVPRMDKTEKNAIGSPANGLLVYQTGPDSIGFHYYDLPNTKWIYINASGFATDTTAWNITGNSNIKSSNFLGTLNDTALRFRVRNTPSGILDSASGNTTLGFNSNAGITTGLNNTFLGFRAGVLNDTTSNSTFLGFYAGERNRNNSNVAVGAQAGRFYSFNNNSTTEMTAVGTDAGHGAFLNPKSTAIGFRALYSRLGGLLHGNSIGRNTAIGDSAMAWAGFGQSNVAVGTNALGIVDNGSYNIAIGDSSLAGALNTNGNVAIGYKTLAKQQGQGFNTAVGYYSQRDSSVNTYYNTSIGSYSMEFNRTGIYNTGLGLSALRNSDSASYNTAVGADAMYTHKKGNENTAVGHEAMQLDSAGWYNVAVGWRSLRNNKTGQENTALGVGALEADSSGNWNTAVGRYSGFLNKRGDYNVSMGMQSAVSNDTADVTTFVGYVSGYYNRNHYNTGYGAYSLAYNNFTTGSNTTGAENTGLGYGAGYRINLGSKNTAVGYQAMNSGGPYISGNRNTAMGDSSLFNFSTGNDNVAMGFKALSNAQTGSQSVAVGSRALRNYSGGYPNTAIGYSSMDSAVTNGANTAVGSYTFTSNKTGINNVAVGNAAMYESTLGSNNTAVGNDAGRFISENQNTAVGASALRNDSTGSNNVSIGYLSTYLADSASAVVAVGNEALYFNKADSNVAIGYRAGWGLGFNLSYPGTEATMIGTLAGNGAFISNKNTAVGFKALAQRAPNGVATDYIGGGRNTAIGDSAMTNSVGISNVAIGAQALPNAGVGVFQNVAIGDSAMGNAQNNSGNNFDNVAIGYKSMTQVKNQGNVTMGSYAGRQLGNTVWNTAIGYHALEADTTGSENTVIGTSAFRNSADGIRNVSLGINTGFWATGDYNTYIGSYAGQGISGRSTGNSNVAVGDYAMQNARSAAQNVAIGENALGNDSTGNLNVALGAGAMDQHLRGDENVGLGFWAGRLDSAGINSVYVGSRAGYNNNRSNTVAIGYQALYNNSIGATVAQALNNVAIGTTALQSNTLGSSNTAVGNSTLLTNTTGSQNTSLGYLSNVSSGALVNATAIGANAFIAQSNSMVLGSINGVNSATATTSVGIGVNTPGARLHVRRNGASGGTFIANPSMIIEDNTQSYVQLSNPTASENGILSGNAITSIRSGIVFGIDSAMFLRTGGNVNRMIIDNNGYVGVGTTAPSPLTQFHLYEPLAANVNLRIASSGSGLEPGLELVKVGGSDWKLRVNTSGNLVYARAADDFVTTPTDYYQMATNSFIPVNDASCTLGGSANRWTTVYATVGAINTSDARDKENITDLNYGLKEVMKLRPVSFTWKENPQWGKKIGFIAQEVQPVLNEVVQVGDVKSKNAAATTSDQPNTKKESDKLGIYYSDIIPVTVKAIQEQQQTIESQQKQIDNLKKKNEQLEKDMQAIKIKLGIQ